MSINVIGTWSCHATHSEMHAVPRLMQALITEFGFGLSFFDRCNVRGVRTPAQMALKLRRCVNEQVHPLSSD